MSDKYKKIFVKQIGSPIGRKSNQKKILIGLGLKKMNQERELEFSESILGMAKKIPHLVSYRCE